MTPLPMTMALYSTIKFTVADSPVNYWPFLDLIVSTRTMALCWDSWPTHLVMTSFTDVLFPFWSCLRARSCFHVLMILLIRERSALISTSHWRLTSLHTTGRGTESPPRVIRERSALISTSHWRLTSLHTTGTELNHHPESELLCEPSTAPGHGND